MSILQSRDRPWSWTDRYILMFGVALVLLLLGAVAREALTSLGGRPDPTQVAAGLALLGLLYAGYLTLVRGFGPLALPAADAAWLVLSPLPRRQLLTRPAVVLLSVAIAAGLAMGVGLLAVLGTPQHTIAGVAVALLLGACVSVGGAAVTVLAQASETVDMWLRAGVVAVTLTSVAAALMSDLTGRVVQAAPTAPAAVLVATSVAASAAVCTLAWSRIDQIHARDLLAASTRLNRVANATVMLEPSSVTWIAEDAHWRGRVLRSRRWPALPASLVLAWHDWRRLGRRPGRLAVLVGSAALPALVTISIGNVTPVVVVLMLGGALSAAASCTAGERRDTTDLALARLWGLRRGSAMAGRAVLPGLIGGLWMALALAGLQVTGHLPPGPWWTLALPVAPAMAAGALRMARRPPLYHAMHPIDTPFGLLPTGPLVWALAGTDVALLGSLPALYALLTPSGILGPSVVAQTIVGATVLGFVLVRANTR